jgi:hypothetical protein
VHPVEVVGRAVGRGVRVVAVLPHGGDGGVAPLRHHAPRRPRVRQVAPQHHVLDQHVHRVLRAPSPPPPGVEAAESVAASAAAALILDLGWVRWRRDTLVSVGRRNAVVGTAAATGDGR